MVKLFVEGGGDANALKTACRKAFTEFITKAGVVKRPRIIACGGRQNAYESFCTAVKVGEPAMLLVDSEAPVENQFEEGELKDWRPWGHLKDRDGWNKPTNAAETDCHLMVQVMESWLLVDRDTLKHYFGEGFKESALPAMQNAVEDIAKAQVYRDLATATHGCRKKGGYNKGSHSFELLGQIDPKRVIAASPWAERFIEQLKTKMGS